MCHKQSVNGEVEGKSIKMLIVRYLIALVFSIFMMATSLRIGERYKRNGDYKISTPDRWVLQMQRNGLKQLQARRLEIE